MKYCTRCVYPANHPLNITFDDLGVCSGCRVHEEKDQLDWSQREERLLELLDEYRCNGKKQYDCIIPVSGAKDSYFIVHKVKNIYKLNPLLVSFNHQYNTKLGIRNLEKLRTEFDCDLMTMTIDPNLAKKLVRETLQKLGSIYWYIHAGSKTFPVQIAARFGIPLIIWGAHQGLDQVGMFSHLDEVKMTRKYRKEHDLMGVDAEDLIDISFNLSVNEMRRFMYPSDAQIEKHTIRGIYLGNYLRWDSKTQHEKMIKLYGYETGKQTRTFNTYEDVDSFMYSDVHDYIKFLKFGYGKVSDHVSREIRLKRMTRDEGIELVMKYQDKAPNYLPMFLRWAKITERDFYNAMNKHRDPEIWKKNNAGEWELSDDIYSHRNDTGVDNVELEKIGNWDYQLTGSRAPNDIEDDLVLMMRGFVED
jgi:N-acetyl sugar amidotransferase